MHLRPMRRLICFATRLGPLITCANGWAQEPERPKGVLILGAAKLVHRQHTQRRQHFAVGSFSRRFQIPRQ